MLIECLKSYLDHCDVNIFDIFVADTGSTDDEKNQIKNSKLQVLNLEFGIFFIGILNKTNPINI
jgi:glycosyltransferase involved in cell wall biosynthesis